MNTRDPGSILDNPDWLPLRYDRGRREFHFALLPREKRRAIPLLTGPQAADAERVVLSRQSLEDMARSAVPIHAILHPGLGGSTLLGDALDVPGLLTVLKEPPLLDDVVAAGLQDGGVDPALLSLALALLARPFEPGEAVVIKATSITNALLADRARAEPEMKVLFLQAPIEIYLASAVRKGMWGRIWGRRLLVGLQNARQVPISLEGGEMAGMTDLQMCALGWLTIAWHVHRLGEARSWSDMMRLESETLFEEPQASLERIGTFFAPGREQRLVPSAELLSRHAKTGQPYNPEMRRAEIDAALTVHREEIVMVVKWMEESARRLGMAMERPVAL